MSAIHNHSIAQRRQRYLKSIRSMQLNNFKKKQRETLIKQINPVYEVHQLKKSLAAMNIQYFSTEITEILIKIGRCVVDSEFMLEVRSCYLLQQLYDVILGDLRRKSYLEAPKLVQMLLTLTYELLPQGEKVLNLVENSFNYFIFALHRYPNHHKVLQSVAGFFNYFKMFSTNHYWQQRYQYNKMVDQDTLISSLFNNYLLEQSYEILWGQSQFAECCDQGTQKWYKNARMMLEIVNSLMLMNCSRQKILGNPTVKNSLFTAIKVYAEHIRNSPSSLFDVQESDFDASSESTHQSNGKQSVRDDCENQFIILILDLCLMKSDLMASSQSQLLKQLLEMTLNKSDQSQNLREVSVKIMKILYQQVILDDEELESIGKVYPFISPFVQTIINDFI